MEAVLPSPGDKVIKWLRIKVIIWGVKIILVALSKQPLYQINVEFGHKARLFSLIILSLRVTKCVARKDFTTLQK